MGSSTVAVSCPTTLHLFIECLDRSSSLQSRVLRNVVCELAAPPRLACTTVNKLA